MKAPRIIRSVTLRSRRGIVLFVSGALAMGIGVAGVRALENGSTAADHVEAPGPANRTPAAPPRPPTALTKPSSSAEPAPDPNALTDGVYQTFVRAVDVQGAEITVDVIEVFIGEAEQHQAAIEDGVDWDQVKYDPIYVRNENPLLRKLPVAWDVRILFFGWCDYPERWAGLTELREEVASSGEGWYYEIKITDGEVVAIEQKEVFSGC